MNDVGAGTQAGKSKWRTVGKTSLWLAGIAWGLPLLFILGLLLLDILYRGNPAVKEFLDYSGAGHLIVYSLPVLVACSFMCGLSAAISGFFVLISRSQKGARAFGSAFFGFLFGLICVIVVSLIVVFVILLFWYASPSLEGRWW
jgi:hypothetical protein